jgi:hypothetical protein
MHPSAVGGVQRYVAHAQEDFAVDWLRHGAFDEAEMLGPELARRLIDQQDLPIDALFHDKSPFRHFLSIGVMPPPALRTNRVVAW